MHAGSAPAVGTGTPCMRPHHSPPAAVPASAIIPSLERPADATDIPKDDDGSAGPVRLPSPAVFNSTPYSVAWISTNGYIAFGEDAE